MIMADVKYFIIACQCSP